MATFEISSATLQLSRGCSVYGNKKARKKGTRTRMRVWESGTVLCRPEIQVSLFNCLLSTLGDLIAGTIFNDVTFGKSEKEITSVSRRSSSFRHSPKTHRDKRRVSMRSRTFGGELRPVKGEKSQRNTAPTSLNSWSMKFEGHVARKICATRNWYSFSRQIAEDI